jgi:PIN domain nuclease of toxin-antitoxin system
VKLLLDTCTFLWLNLDDAALSRNARSMCLDPENELYLSVVSSWEIAIKAAAGRLRLPEPVAEYVPSRRERNGIRTLELTEEAVLQLPLLPALHADPFDRILVCQGIVHGLAVVTPDPWIRRYPGRVVW